MCHNINKSFNDKVENELKNLEKTLSFNPVTDSPITVTEIKQVLKKLKKGKASGPDGIGNEIIKHSSCLTIKALAKLFNLIMNSGYYPVKWNQSYMILLHKSGSKTDPSNYRGISLINCISKIFSGVLNGRLIKIMEDKFSNSQFGFRENHRTSDSLFILKSLINKYIHKKKQKLFICFVDLQKAFDSVWRDGLLFKLANIGVGEKIYNIIKSHFYKTETAFKLENLHSNFFETTRGVRQGDSISPTLFNIFINDLDKAFNSEGTNSPTLVNSKVGSLLFADDLLIISESNEGLQNSINNPATF